MNAYWLNPLLPVKLVGMGSQLLFAFAIADVLPRRDHFGRRFFLCSAGCMAVAALLPILSDNLWFITSTLLVIYAATVLTIRCCWRGTRSTVLFLSAAVFSVDHIASMLDTLTSLFFPEQLSYIASQQMNGFILLNYALWRLLIFLLVRLLVRRGTLKVEESSVSSAFAVLMLVISLFVNLYLNLIFQNLVDNHTFWFSLINCVMNILISSLLLFCQYMVVRENHARLQLQISDLLREQAREQFRISRENVEAISAKCHDLKHLLLAVRDVIDPVEYASMMEMINSYGAEIHTDNEVLDVIFQEKNFQCRKQGIQFTCIIDGAAVNFMGTTDQYILFGNLLDNAIEAVSRLPEGEVKNIQVTVRRDKGFVIITTENGYAGELQWNGGRLRTSKKDKQSHGFGILSIEKIVHKYGGRYSISTEDQIFAMNIVLPAGQAEAKEK